MADFTKKDILDINLNTGNIYRSFITHSIGYKDGDADRFGIRAFRDGVPVDLSGVSCQGVFMAPNGAKIALTSYGTVSGNEAYITLPPACYDYEGQFCLSIKLSGEGVTGTMRIIDGIVSDTGASGTVAPTDSVPTYQEIIAQYDAMVAATAAANGCIAETFDATKYYAKGKYVINSGALYRLTAPHEANTTWQNTQKVQVYFGDDLTGFKEDLDDLDEKITEVRCSSDTLGLLFIDTNKLERAHYTNGFYRYYDSGEIRTNADYSYSDYIVITPGAYCVLENVTNPHTTFYDENYTYISGTRNTAFVIPESAVYMVLSISISEQATASAKWTDNRITTKQIIIMDDSVLTDFDDAEWNRIYSFNLVLESSWNNIDHIPINENGTLITIDTNYTHYAARQIYITVTSGIFTRFYIPSSGSFTDWVSSLTSSVPKFINNPDDIADFDNAKWNRWYVINLADSSWASVLNAPVKENGTLITLDTNTLHYAARQIYITNTGAVYVRFYAQPISAFSEWESQTTVSAKKVGVLYNKELTSANASEFAGSFSVVTGGYSITKNAILGKFYSIENRSCEYLCKVFSDSVVAFITAPYTDVSTANASLVLDVANKTVKLNDFEAESCAFLAANHILTVEMSKRYQKYGIRITDMMTGDVFKKEYIKNGTGGAGEGAIGTDNNVQMQYDYYGCKKISGTAVLLKKMTVKCDVADVVCYGDSITEQEAYWPTDLFEKTWTQMLIAESSQKVVTSGRSGSAINSLIERIKNELPYIPAKFCMITIGTNGGNTEANLTSLVEYVKSLGVVPFLNHIPCYDNNGDTTGFIDRNATIDTVRAATGVRGCDFDLATSLAYDGQELNPDMMWLETYSGGAEYRHHPNVAGCAAMLAQLKNDLPEIF